MESVGLTCIVGDEADYRFLVQQLFSRYLPTYPVRFFAGGQDLLDALPGLAERPSLIILDRHMPGLDGHQTLVRLKQHPTYQTIPVVMMSAAASLAEVEDCYQAGVNSFLIKRLEFTTLRQTMMSICQYWVDLNLHPVEA